MQAGEAVPAPRRLAVRTSAAGGGAQGSQVHLGAAVPRALCQIYQQAQQPSRQVPFVLCRNAGNHSCSAERRAVGLHPRILPAAPADVVQVSHLVAC